LGTEKEIRTQSVYRKPTVLPCGHVRRGLRVEQARSPEPPDESLSHSRGELREVAWGDGSRRQERDACLSLVTRRGPGELAVGHAHMQMHMPIECRAFLGAGKETAPMRGGSLAALSGADGTPAQTRS